MTAVSPVIAPIVEGDGEEQAIRLLIQQIGYVRLGRYIEVTKAYRLGRGKMLHHAELCRAVRLQNEAVSASQGGVLVVLDADDDCPVELHDTVERLVKASGLSCEVVAANREYEAWFLAAMQSLWMHRHVRDDAAYDEDPDSPRDAKGCLADRMNTRYRPKEHQPAFSSLVDPDLAFIRSRSFRRLCKAVEVLAGGTT